MVSESSFDSGGERNVFEMRFLAPDGRTPVPGDWVAKRNKHVEPSRERELEFHRMNLITQAMARQYATRFNAATAKLKWRAECVRRGSIARQCPRPG